MTLPGPRQAGDELAASAVKPPEAQGLRPVPAGLVKARLIWRGGGVFLVLAAVYVVAAISAPGFFAHGNQVNILRSVSVIGVMAMGQTIVAIAGGLADVSSGAIVSLSAVLALGLQGTFGAGGATVLALLAGIAAGAANGVLVGPFRTNPVVATIGSGVVVEGITLGYTKGNTQYGHSRGFANLGTGSVLGIPNLVIAFILVTFVVHLVLRYSTLGFRFAATGAGLEATRAAGIRVRQVVACAFLLSGVAAAIAGVMQAALLNSVNYDTGDSYTFTSIAAVAIGGTSLFGGSGSAVRTLGGVALIGLLDNIVVLYGLPLPLQTLLTGVVILAAVVADRLTREETR